jgi:hypothetical protein
MSVIACMDEGLPTTIEGMPLRLSRHFYLGQVLPRTEVNLPMEQLVAMGVEYIRLSDELKDVLAGVIDPELGRVARGPDGELDWAADLAGSTLPQLLTDRHSLAALLQACEAADEGIIRRLLWFVGGRESTAHLIFEAAWLAEIKTAIADWPAFVRFSSMPTHSGDDARCQVWRKARLWRSRG